MWEQMRTRSPEVILQIGRRVRVERMGTVPGGGWTCSGRMCPLSTSEALSQPTCSCGPEEQAVVRLGCSASFLTWRGPNPLQVFFLLL